MNIIKNSFIKYSSAISCNLSNIHRASVMPRDFSRRHILPHLILCSVYIRTRMIIGRSGLAHFAKASCLFLSGKRNQLTSPAEVRYI